MGSQWVLKGEYMHTQGIYGGGPSGGNSVTQGLYVVPKGKYMRFQNGIYVHTRGI